MLRTSPGSGNGPYSRQFKPRVADAWGSPPTGDHAPIFGFLNGGNREDTLRALLRRPGYYRALLRCEVTDTPFSEYYGSDSGFSTMSVGPEVWVTVDTTMQAAETTNGSTGSPGRFIFHRNGDLTAPLTVRFDYSGTATAGTDYGVMPDFAVFGPGQATTPLTITPINDTLPEADETVTVTLRADPAYAVAEPSSATISIIDNDRSVQIALPDGKYIGAGRDQNPLTVQAVTAPANLTGQTYSWSVSAGPGNGTFTPATAQTTQFRGTTEGRATVRVDMTYQSSTYQDTDEVIVVRIDDLTEEVTPQLMDDVTVADGGQYVIPFNDSAGELRAVRISPCEDTQAPYLWGQDFQGVVNHQSGDVTLTFMSTDHIC